MLLRDGAEVLTIAESVPLNSWFGLVYVWYPPSLPTSDRYRVKAISKDYPDVFDVSDGFFRIYKDPTQPGY